MLKQAQKLIQGCGKKLRIKDEKCSVFSFTKCGHSQSFKLVYGSQGENGLEYLGFRFDGRKVFLRDSTLSNLQRKVSRTSRAAAQRLVKRYPGKDFAFIKARTDIEAIIQKFGRVRDFTDSSGDYRTWTFWTYARKASKVFDSLGNPILKQLKKHRIFVSERFDRALAKQFC